MDGKATAVSQSTSNYSDGGEPKGPSPPTSNNNELMRSDCWASNNSKMGWRTMAAKETQQTDGKAMMALQQMSNLVGGWATTAPLPPTANNNQLMHSGRQALTALTTKTTT